MKILDQAEIYNTSLTLLSSTLLKIDFGNTFERELTRKFSLLGKDKELLKILRTFNEDILAVNTSEQLYTVKEDYFNKSVKNAKIHLSNLSTGERVFAICYMAQCTKTKITICHDFGQLDMPHYKLFFKYWAKCPYIDIIIVNERIGFIATKLYNREMEEH